MTGTGAAFTGMTGAALPSAVRLLRFDSVGSTMDVARAEAADGAPGWTAVTAVEQTGGRGRRGRAWASPPGNLYLSLLLRPEDPAVLHWLPFAAAVALHEAVTPALPEAARNLLRLKWPNDLLLDGAKLAGILIEAEPDRGTAILGMGLNVASAPPAVSGGYATTFLAEKGAEAALEPLLHRLLAALHARVGAPAEDLRSAWLARASGIGGPVTVRLPDRELHGRFDGLGADGALLLRGADGAVQRILAGDVFLRPAQAG